MTEAWRECPISEKVELAGRKEITYDDHIRWCNAAGTQVFRYACRDCPIPARLDRVTVEIEGKQVRLDAQAVQGIIESWLWKRRKAQVKFGTSGITAGVICLEEGWAEDHADAEIERCRKGEV